LPRGGFEERSVEVVVLADGEFSQLLWARITILKNNVGQVGNNRQGCAFVTFAHSEDGRSRQAFDQISFGDFERPIKKIGLANVVAQRLKTGMG
jgi:hypothetical protein